MMYLPPYVRTCLDRLETAGFAAYAVGGCVRDSLLGLAPQDFDLCTAATPAQIQQVFSECRLILAGEKHGTVTVVMDAQLVEITTFRLEGGYQDNRHPDWVKFVASVEEDLNPHYLLFTQKYQVLTGHRKHIRVVMYLKAGVVWFIILIEEKWMMKQLM